MQLDVSHLVGEACAVAMDGHDGRVVQCPEVGPRTVRPRSGEEGLITASQSVRPRCFTGDTS